PELRVRVVNVVDLMPLQSESEHPPGLPDRDLHALFTTNKPILFASPGYPWLIPRPTYRPTTNANTPLRGSTAEGTPTPPFDMAGLSDIDRFDLVSDVIDRVEKLGAHAAYAKQAVRDKLVEHREYIHRYGQDMPEVRNWEWSAADAPPGSEANP